MVGHPSPAAKWRVRCTEERGQFGVRGQFVCLCVHGQFGSAVGQCKIVLEDRDESRVMLRSAGTTCETFASGDGGRVRSTVVVPGPGRVSLSSEYTCVVPSIRPVLLCRFGEVFGRNYRRKHNECPTSFYQTVSARRKDICLGLSTSCCSFIMRRVIFTVLGLVAAVDESLDHGKNSVRTACPVSKARVRAIEKFQRAFISSFLLR